MENKRPSYTRPWFWLLIVLVLSSVFKLVPKNDIFHVSDDTSVPKSELPVGEITETKTDNEGSDTETEEYIQTDSQKSMFHFILNTSTKKYHTTECTGVKKLSESKRTDTDIEADTQEEAKKIIERDGYELCGICAKQVQE